MNIPVPADLAHGASWRKVPSSLRSMFVGPVADRIVRHARQSVLVVRGA